MTVAWLFPGQGSQAVGMARDVLDASAAARAVFARADAALAGAWPDGRRLSQLILEGPKEELTLTANAQPALVATSIAILEAIREIAPDAPAPALAAGHSLGEYSALVAAGALSLEDAVRVVRARGQAMQDAVPAGVGAMAAVMSVELPRLTELCAAAIEGHPGETVAPANFNSPGQIVVAGHAGAVARLRELVAAEKGKAIALEVSAPFHCTLMAPAARALEPVLAAAAFVEGTFPVIANFDARPNRDPARARDLLIRQVDGAVRWEESIRWMAAGGVTHALEIGPGKVLANFAKRIVKDVRVLSVSDAASLAQVPAFLAEAAEAALATERTTLVGLVGLAAVGLAGVGAPGPAMEPT
jgi:[acyl-carrier-protein] S-malonyltransferase